MMHQVLYIVQLPNEMTCTLYSTWCSHVIPILSLLLFIESLHSLSHLLVYIRYDVHTYTLMVLTRLLTLADCSSRLVRKPRPNAVNFAYTSPGGGAGAGEFLINLS